MGIKEICGVLGKDGKGLIAVYGSGNRVVAGNVNGGVSPVVRSLGTSQSGVFPLANDGGRSIATPRSNDRMAVGGAELKSSVERSDRAILEMAYLICYEA